MPIINREGSDSAILDNVLEFLVMNGRPLTRAASMLLPEPWDHNDSLSEERRAYDAYQSMLMEPWDGPAAIAFTDGRTLGAALDRNGLRPARYFVTRDGRFMLASEVGAIEVSPENILTSGCLGPGQMLEVDFARGRVIYNDELRARYAKEKPYRDWIAEETLTVDALDEPVAATPAEDAEVPAAVRMAKLGYHWMMLTRSCAPWPSRARPRSPRWALTHRWPACPRRRVRSLTTSISCSPRLRTRRSMPCASTWSPRPRSTWQPRQPARGFPHGLPAGAPGAPVAQRGGVRPHLRHRPRGL